MTQHSFDPASKNRNFAQPDKWHFTLPGLPTLALFDDGISLPGFSTQSPIQHTPRIDLKRLGDKIEFTPLLVTFKIDEDYRVWEEVYKWFVGFAPITAQQMYGRDMPTGLVQDGILEMDTNSNVLNLKFVFRNCHPTSVTPVQLSYLEDGRQVMTATITFDFDWYEIIR